MSDRMKSNSRGMEMAISTIVILVLAIVLLVALILAIRSGFFSFQSSTKPLLDTNQFAAAKQTCSLACSQEDKLTYCCKQFKVESSTFNCTDSALGLSCGVSCEGFSCSG